MKQSSYLPPQCYHDILAMQELRLLKLQRAMLAPSINVAKNITRLHDQINRTVLPNTYVEKLVSPIRQYLTNIDNFTNQFYTLGETSVESKEFHKTALETVDYIEAINEHDMTLEPRSEIVNLPKNNKLTVNQRSAIIKAIVGMVASAFIGAIAATAVSYIVPNPPDPQLEKINQNIEKLIEMQYIAGENNNNNGD